MNSHFEALEFPIIIKKVQDFALSEAAKASLSRLIPEKNEDVCRRLMAETMAAKRVLEGCGSPPLSAMTGLEPLIDLAEKGGMLLPEQLSVVASFAENSKRLIAYLKRGESCGAQIAVYGRNMESLPGLREEIETCISGERVLDEASPALKTVRRKMERVESQIKEKLAHILQSKKQFLAESFISVRGGHYVLPVQRRYQSQFGGSVIDTSGKGTTVFMEPAAVEALQSERGALAVEEDGEVRRILYTLSALIAEHGAAIRRNIDVMEMLDVLFAKAKYGASLKARAVEIGGERRIDIRDGRHPLLDPEACVPLCFSMDETISGVIITGPNTGGKTVTMKTIGLLSMMAQCGLLIPCGEGSYLPMQDGFWCDIGDSQNISQNLSTFSGHMTNVIQILKQASKDSLVLLDELGSGTDPAEGVGIAVAVLEELRARGCMFITTTHYSQVKEYAEKTQGILSARMAFDRENLRPLYQMEMGKSGESCALYIAGRLGMPDYLLERASNVVYGTPIEKNKQSLIPPPSRLIRTAPEKRKGPVSQFHTGDSVAVLPDKQKGIVYLPEDELGNVIVQVKGVKCKVKHSRLLLLVAADQLYPPDYDFSILFDTVGNRKARHSMNRRFDSAAQINHEDDEYCDYATIDWSKVRNDG
ncbi:MAG: DNA mismatch repair protein MutS [Eubacteriales bacterium]|nr:DNA mismatch repair protein MutS [Eubacteriales bacterium]